MSSLRRSLLVLLPVAVLAFGCSEKNENVLFDPSAGHPESWLAEHGGASQRSDCSECHGADLRGGISLVSCFATSVDGTRCHGSGPGTRHPRGWAAGTFHGPPAKALPGEETGFESCQQCHGEDYQGGIVDLACLVCHGVPAPHPQKPWRNNRSYSHTSTKTANAPVCADCHRKDRGSPGCYNNTLCHGPRNVHDPDWARPRQHGAEAKKGPARGGFAECKKCHGSDFRGGSRGDSGVSCYKCHIRAPHPNRLVWGMPKLEHSDTHGANFPVCDDCHSIPVDPPIPGCQPCHKQP